MLQPTVNIVGNFFGVNEGNFVNSKGEKITFYQISLITDDQYKPLMVFSTTEQIFDQLSKDVAKFQNKEIDMSGTISNQSTQVNGQWITKQKVRIDKVTFI